MVHKIQTFKGLGFVSITGVLLFVLSKGNIRAITTIYKEKITAQRIYKALLENSSDLTILANNSGVISYVASNVERLLGYTILEFKQLNFYDLLDKDDEQWIKQLRRVLKDNVGKVYTIELRVKHKNGDYIWFEFSCVYRDDQPDVSGILYNSRDISERKNAELLLAKKDLELNTLIYRSSHDLRGPITTLIGLNDMALADVKDEKAVDYFSASQEVAIKLDKILISLLAITQLKQESLNPVQLFPATLLNDVVAATAINKKVDQSELFVTADSNMTFVTDITLFKTIVYPLVENAINFSKHNGNNRINIGVSQGWEDVERNYR